LIRKRGEKRKYPQLDRKSGRFTGKGREKSSSSITEKSLKTY
jgi:hypothetical protein